MKNNCALQVPFQASNLPAMALQICTMDFKPLPEEFSFSEKKSDKLSASEKASILKEFLRSFNFVFELSTKFCFSKFWLSRHEASFIGTSCQGPDLHALVHQLLQKAFFWSCWTKDHQSWIQKNDVWFFEFEFHLLIYSLKYWIIVWSLEWFRLLDLSGPTSETCHVGSRRGALCEG